MDDMTVPVALAVLGYGWLIAFIVGVFYVGCRKGPEPVPDPAFRDRALAEDDQWAGVESEWHAFVDSFGVREAQR